MKKELTKEEKDCLRKCFTERQDCGQAKGKPLACHREHEKCADECESPHQGG